MRVFALALATLSITTSMFGQGPAQPVQPATAPANVPQAGLNLPQAGFQGSFPTGSLAPSLTISLQDAIDRGLKTNLGLLETQTGSELARAERRRALSALMPQIGGQVDLTEQQLNLATFGFHFAGLPIPAIVGPFHFFEAQAVFSQKVYDLTSIRNRRSAIQNEQAAVLSVKDARDLVVQSVAAGYLAIIADAARIEATRAQVATAQALYERARDQHAAGTSPAIDELRAEVELKTRQQELLAQLNQRDKDKLALGRVIGLPNGQPFELGDAVPFAPLELMTPEALLERAYKTRADYQSAMMQVRAAETSRQAATAQRYPSGQLNANYGAAGIAVDNSHGVFTVTGSLSFNIFDGGRIRSDIEQADAIIQQRKNELADLQGQIDYQVRAALLDLKTAADQVAVAQDNLHLADETLTQARDRFAAGVTDNIEVVQAQDSVAAANNSLISATYSHNLAKVSLARAVGGSETSLKEFMGGK